MQKMNRYKLSQKYTAKITRVIIVLVFSLSLWQLTSAGWIQGKALVAQILLSHSWHQTLNNPQHQQLVQNHTEQTSAKYADKYSVKNAMHKPWPWADTWPVAKLSVPQHNIEQIVVAGDSGSSLAFAPGYSLASAAPNTPGTTMISAHRDTHFSFLKKLKINDSLYLQTAEQTTRYQVYAMQIVDSQSVTVQTDNDEQTLVLATCYPFDSMISGGSLRYLVFAHKKP